MPYKLLVVDDSALMRRMLVQLFEGSGDFLVRTAHHGRQAVHENQVWQPNVITLDINMPQLDGLSALAEIMATRPVPVVMVSSLTEKGALATFEALALGAVDYVAKPGGTISLSIDEIKLTLVDKVRAAARIPASRLPLGSLARMRCEQNVRSRSTPKASFVRRSASYVDGLVLIGVSTGGPTALETLLPQLPADYPYPVLVAQHMPAAFTATFAQRLDQFCPMRVEEVQRPTEIQPGRIYIARGGADMVLAPRMGKLMVLPQPENSTYLWHPSVERLARSALEHCKAEHLIAVMLTGMGHDGAEAFSEIKRLGGRTISESNETAVVWGMPGELVRRDGASIVLSLPDIAEQLRAWAA